VPVIEFIGGEALSIVAMVEGDEDVVDAEQLAADVVDETTVTKGRAPPSHVWPNRMPVGVVLWLADVGVGWQRNAMSS
jgi:hypothetical protein